MQNNSIDILMIETIEKKIGMSIEEYIRRMDERLKNVTTEDDNPHEVADTSVLTDEELDCLMDRIYQLDNQMNRIAEPQS